MGNLRGKRGKRTASDGASAESLSTTRRRVLATVGAGLTGTAAGSVVGTAGAVGGSTPPLHTAGRWIRNQSGEDVKLRGFATAGLEFVSNSWYPFSTTELLQRATDGEDWHPNTIRLPVTEWPVIEQGPSYVVDELLRPAVDVLADQGVYAVIDFHLIRPYVETMAHAEGMVADGWAETIDDLGFDADVATHDLLMDFWSAVAPEFADDDHVLFELFNEPTLPVEWSSYGEQGPQITSHEDEWLLWRDTAQPWVDEIRAHAPETPIIVGSPDWTSRPNFATEYPFEGDNLVYAGHIYPPNGQPDEFDSTYGAPAEEVPVVISEFGWDPDLAEDDEGYGTTSEWGQPFREWAESYDNLGWLGWCFDYSWAPAFFDSPENQPQPWELKDGADQHGGFIQNWLAETEGDDESSTGPTAVGDNANAPQDPDGDGLYEDVNGNDEQDLADAVDLFQHRDSVAVQDNADAFDFSGNEKIDLADVVELFTENSN